MYQEIKNYGHDSTKKQLIAGIVLTGGGAQLKHLKQLVEFITGMDTRVGYPNEHMAGNSDPETTSPLYATAVGLVMDVLENLEKESEISVSKKETQKVEAPVNAAAADITKEFKEPVEVAEEEPYERPLKRSPITLPKKGMFERWASKFKEFLDNAE